MFTILLESWWEKRHNRERFENQNSNSLLQPENEEFFSSLRAVQQRVKKADNRQISRSTLCFNEANPRNRRIQLILEFPNMSGRNLFK